MTARTPQQRPSAKARLAQRSSRLAAAGVGSALVGIVWWTLALRLSTADQVGGYVAMMAIASLAADFGNLGLGYASIRFTHVWGRRASALLRTAVIVVALSTAIAASILAAGVVIFGAAAIPGGIGDFVLLVAAALGLGLFALTDNLLLATGRTDVLMIRAIATALGRVGVLFLLAVTGSLHAEGLLFSFAGPMIVATAVALVALRRSLLGDGARFMTRRESRIVVGYAAPSYGGNLLSMLLVSLLPLLVVVELGQASAARFGAMWVISSLMMLVPTAVAFAAFAGGARSEGSPTDLSRQGSRLVLLFQIPVTVAALLVAPLVFPLLGSAYASIGLAELGPLLAGVLLFGLTSQMYSRLRLERGGLRVVLAGQLLQLATVVILARLLMPRLDLAGVGWAWLFGNVLSFAFVRVLLAVRSRRNAGVVRREGAGPKTSTQGVMTDHLGADSAGDRRVLTGNPDDSTSRPSQETAP